MKEQQQRNYGIQETSNWSIDSSGNICLLLPLFFSSQPVLPHIPLVLHQGTSHSLK